MSLISQHDRAWYAHIQDPRVTLLRGVDAQHLAVSLDPLPGDAPAVVSIELTDIRSQHVVVDTILEGLETAARRLFPAWLPGGENLHGPNRVDLLAARAMSSNLASRTDHFGPFLAAMAESALHDRAVGRRFIDQTRAEGLRRLLAATYSRESVAVNVRVDPAQTTHQLAQLVGGCLWLANHGGFAVWIVGPDDVGSDHVRIISPSVGSFTTPAPVVPQRIYVPAIAGRPHPGSAAEKKLERALSSCVWATGREWNQPFQATSLHERIVVDLRWPKERCLVEIDGDDHRHPIKFARDRERDVVLQLDGYAVLRFTNAQILDDVTAVVSAIEKYIKIKRGYASRAAYIEGTPRGE